jgi:hypothetical protein
MVLIALLFVPCMVVAITVALPVLLFLAAVIAMVYVWYQSAISAVSGLRVKVVTSFHRREHHQSTPAPSPQLRRHTTAATNAAATETTLHSRSTIKPTTVQELISPLASETNVVSLIPDAYSKRFALRNDNLDSSMSSPAAKLAPCTSTYPSRSGHPVAARRDCDFELTPRRRVRFG